MPEDKSSGGSERKPDLEIAAADWLFDDGPGPKPADQAGKHVGPVAAGSGETFALEGDFGSAEMPVVSPVPAAVEAPPRVSTRSRREGKSDRSASQPMLEPSAMVEETWSRWAEWGPTLFFIGCWLGAAAFAVYLLFGMEAYGLAFLTLLGGGIGAILLSYPILITLERPVRITPEQAVRDYYGALSHHFPHFRRMWLLLSTAGRTSTAYGSLEGLKAYWKAQLRSLRAGHAGSLTPLVFEVADFKADKSAGKVRIDAEYTLKIWVRGKRKAGAIHAVPMHVTLARGPDKMWYLDQGTIGATPIDRRINNTRPGAGANLNGLASSWEGESPHEPIASADTASPGVPESRSWQGESPHEPIASANTASLGVPESRSWQGRVWLGEKLSLHRFRVDRVFIDEPRGTQMPGLCWSSAFWRLFTMSTRADRLKPELQRLPAEDPPSGGFLRYQPEQTG